MHGKVVYTNNTLAGAMRGFGAPQVAFAIEAQMDGMAAELGIDPLEFRLMNRRVTDASEATPMDLQQEDAYEKTVEAVRPFYTEALSSRPNRSEGNGRYRRGIGIASMRYGVGASGRARAPGRVSLELGLDGGLRLLTGAVDMGQGSDTALSIIAAGELSQPMSSITIVTGDTEITPDAGTSTGSRLVYYVGNAAKDSAMQL
ncbi:MAG: molybdopterin-dependent oxidoreductase [Chloroflexi bacterium]|nr:molybdopterin-dependent oxidoreductase [Chloroflexota bacterium]